MRYKEEVKITHGQQHRHHSLQRTAFASYQPLALYLRILRLTRTALSIPDNTPLHFLYGSASKGGEEMMFRSYPDVMTVKQLAAALGIGINKAYEIVNDGTINSKRIGRRILIPKLYLVDYIQQTRYNKGV